MAEAPFPERAFNDLRPRPSLGVALLAIFYALLIFAYPVFADAAFERFGVVASASALCAFAALFFVSGRRFAPEIQGAGSWLGLGLVALPLLAAITGERSWLLGVPAWVCLTLAWLLAVSLRDEDSLMERGVKLLHPWAPEFVRPYLRKLTAFWAGLFLVNAVVIAALATLAPLDSWKAYTSWVQYAIMLVISGVEFLIRKIWFRYYYSMGPIDRLLSTFFPAEATPEGRRSIAHIRRWREELQARALRSAS